MGKIREVICESKNIYGNSIKLQIVHHNDAVCCEYIVENERFNFMRWFLWTVILSCLSIGFNLHHENDTLLLGILIILFVILVCKLHFKVRKESVLVITSLGIQLTTTFASGRKTSQFVDKSQIEDVVINEGITMHKVIFYLAILLKGTQPNTLSGLLPLFQHSWPRFDCLRQVYNGIQCVLFSDMKDGVS